MVLTKKHFFFFFQNTYFVRQILESDVGIPIRKNTDNTNIS